MSALHNKTNTFTYFTSSFAHYVLWSQLFALLTIFCDDMKIHVEQKIARWN